MPHAKRTVNQLTRLTINKKVKHVNLLICQFVNLSKGFTLIELLIVISIIGILAAMSMFSYNTVQAKARDTHRKADFDDIAKAIVQYASDNGTPPPMGSSSCTAGQLFPGCSFTDPTGSPVYMNKVPNDPKAGVAGCGASGTTVCGYYYTTLFWGQNAGCSNKPALYTYLETDKVGNGGDCGNPGWNTQGLYIKIP